MKIRILNGGHQVVAVAGEVLWVDTIAGCMEHKLIGRLFTSIAEREIARLVAAVPDMATKAYIGMIHSRFSNPRIVDTTRRVAFDGSSHHPGFIVSSVRDGLAKSTLIDGLALVEAIWARVCAYKAKLAPKARKGGVSLPQSSSDWQARQATGV